MAMEDDLKRLHAQITAVQSKKAKAAVELDNAKDRLETARTLLKDEFGVTTTTEARAKLEELREELATAIAQIEELLTAAGA